MEGACYLFVLIYLLCIQLVTVTNGLKLPFSSITSKVSPIKPSYSRYCSTSAFERPASSGPSNIASRSSTLGPAKSASFQENSFMNLNSLSTNANLCASNNSYSVQNPVFSNLFQELPGVNLAPTSIPFRCVSNLSSPNTFTIQNPLLSSFPIMSDVAMNNFGSSLTPNINNVAYDSKNMVLVQDPIQPNQSQESIKSKVSLLSSNRNSFDNTLQFQAESPMVTMFVNYPFQLQNAVSSNYCQDLPEVNLNRNPLYYSGFASGTSTVPKTILNQDFNFISNECPSLNQFSNATLSSKSTPVNENTATLCPKTKLPQNSIPVQNLNQGLLTNDFYAANDFTSKPGPLSNFQNSLISHPSNLEPLVSYYPTLLPDCNIFSPYTDSSLNNILTKNNISPYSLPNFNLSPSCLVPKLLHSSSTCNSSCKKVSSSNNIMLNFNLNNVFSPSDSAPSENPMTPVSVNYPFQVQNSVSSNYCQDLPRVNLNRNPSCYSGFGSTTSPVPKTVLNKDINFILNECPTPNLFSIASLTSKSTPVNTNTATICPKTKEPQNSISVPKLNQGCLPNELSAANIVSSQTGSLSNLKNSLNSHPSSLEPLVTYSSTLVPDNCNIFSLHTGSSLNNILTNNILSPQSQSNFNLSPSCLMPELQHSSSICNCSSSKVSSLNNVMLSSNLNNVLSPSDSAPSESPMTPISVVYPFQLQNAVPSNYCQDLPTVNINRNPSCYSGFSSTTSTVPKTILNQDLNFISECLSLNPFSTAPLSKFAPVNAKTPTLCPEIKLPQNSISVPNQNQGLLRNEFFATNSFSPQTGSSSNLQNRFNSHPSNLKPQVTYNPTVLPTCNIFSSFTGPSLNNNFTNNNLSPHSQSNHDLSPSFLMPKLQHSSSTGSSSSSKVPSLNNIMLNSNLNNVLSPYYLASSLVSTKRKVNQSDHGNSIQSSENLNMFAPVPPKSITDFIDYHIACPHNIVTSTVNSLPGVSLGFNTFDQSYFSINSSNMGANRDFINPLQNAELKSSCLKQVIPLSNNRQQLHRIPINTINTYDSFSLTNEPSSTEIKDNSGGLSLFQNAISPEVNISPKWTSLSSVDDLGFKSQIISSNPCVSTTGLFLSNVNILPDVTLSPLNIDKVPLASSATFSVFDQLTPQPTTPFKLTQNNGNSPSLSVWFDNLPVAQIQSLPRHSLPSALKTNPYPKLSDIDYISSPNCFSESNLPQINPFYKTSPSGKMSSKYVDRNNLKKLNLIPENNFFIEPAAPSSAISCIKPQAPFSELLISKTLPNTLVSQPLSGNEFQSNSLPSINSFNYPSVNQPVAGATQGCSNLQLSLSPSNNIGPTKLYKSKFVPNNCPDTVSPFSVSKLVNSFTSPSNSLSSITNNIVNLPNDEVFDSVPCFNSNQALDFEPLVGNYASFNSNRNLIKNNVLNYVPITSLPDVSCNNNAPVYKTAVNSNGLTLNPITDVDIQTYSLQSLPSNSPINYIKTCPDSISTINEFTSALTKSILSAVFSDDLPLKPKSKIPMSLPPVNPYSGQFNSIHNSYSSVLRETPNKLFLEYPQSVQCETNFSPYEKLLGFDSYSDDNFPLTSKLALSDVSNDVSSRIPMNNLPTVNPYMTYFDGNLQTTTPSSLLKTPDVSSILSSYPQSISDVPPDYEQLLDTYSKPGNDNIDNYDYYEPGLISDFSGLPYSSEIIIRPDYKGLMPFASDLSVSSPSFLPSPNIVPSYPYPAPVIKIPDSRGSKELERLLEYIVMLELIDSNYNCDWDLLEEIIALLYAYN